MKITHFVLPPETELNIKAERSILYGRWAFVFLMLIAALLAGNIYTSSVITILSVAAGYLCFLELMFGYKMFQRYLPIVSSICDIVLITWTIHEFGRFFEGLYYAVILVNALRYGMKECFYSASAVSFVYILTGVYYLIKSPNREWSVQSIFIHVFVFCLIAFFAGSLANLRQSEKKRATKFQELDQNKSDLLSIMSHELRTPLSMIKAAVDILMEGKPGPFNQVQQKFLSTISTSCERLINIVEDILARVRVEEAWLKMKPRYVDIRPIFKKTINEITPLISQRNQKIKFEFPRILSKVEVDENWLQQVIINLIYNASKFTSAGRNILVTLKDGDQYVFVSVSDEGVGISEEASEHIFERYFQKSNIPYKAFSGVGLGLSIVKEVIEKHGGRVYVGGMMGKGSTFSFALPKKRLRLNPEI
jgi:two-component system OmpR family sensor kinase